MPSGLGACASWAACHLAPFLGAMVGLYLRVPEVAVWGVAAAIFGFAVRGWRTAAIGGLTIGALALVTLYASSTTPAAAERALWAFSIPVIAGALVVTCAARSVATLISALFRRPPRTFVGPMPKI